MSDSLADPTIAATSNTAAGPADVKRAMPVPTPKEGRCQFYMARKQRYCTVILDGKAAREGWGYCYDHKLQVDAAGGVAPSPTDKKADGAARKDSGSAGSAVVAVSESPVAPAVEEERIPCPFSTLHTIRKANYWHHLKVCPHKPSPSVEYCTRDRCNITAPHLRRPEGEKRPLFADMTEEERQSFIAWVEARYEALKVEESIIVPPCLALAASSSSSSPSTADASPSPLSVASYVRPALAPYVSSGREREATQHVALTNIAELAFFSNPAAFAATVVKSDAMAELASTSSAAAAAAERPVGFLEYGAGKGGLVAAMRMAYPRQPTIVVDRDMFRDMKDAAMQKGGRPSNKKRDRDTAADGDEEAGEGAAAAAQSVASTIPHARLKMNIMDYDVDKCLEGIMAGRVETSLHHHHHHQGGNAPKDAKKKASDTSEGEKEPLALYTAPSGLPEEWIALGKHLCGGCTDMTLRSVVEAKAARFGGIMIATCCHHMCSIDTYVHPSLFGYDAALAVGSAAELEQRAKFQHLLDCCCGTAGWAISGKDIDDGRRLVGRKVKRLLDYGRVQYLKAATRRRGGDGSDADDRVPLFSFVGMVQYTTTSTTEENEVMVAIP